MPTIINIAVRGGEGVLLNSLTMKIFNDSSRTVEDMNMLILIERLRAHNFPKTTVSNRGQVKIGDLVIPARAYSFIRNIWMMSGCTQSQCVRNNEFRSENT